MCLTEAVFDLCLTFALCLNHDNMSKYVTKFWEIILMGVPETIRILGLPVLLISQKHILHISISFLVIQSIFTVLEP